MSDEMDEVLKDYIRWRGDLTFDAVPFNDLDSAVLCELSYVDFFFFFELLNLRGTRLKIAYHKILQKNCYRLDLSVLNAEKITLKKNPTLWMFGLIQV